MGGRAADFAVVVENETYLCRRLSRGEFFTAVKGSGGNRERLEDLIAAAGMVQAPESFAGWDNCLAGVQASLARAIVRKSGWIHDDALFLLVSLDDKGNEQLETDRHLLKEQALEWAAASEAREEALICFCFPSMTPDALDALDPQLWHKYATMAQMIFAGVYGQDPETFLNPAAAGRKAPKAQQGQLAVPDHPAVQSRSHGIRQNKESRVEREVYAFRK